jgi:predicted transposase/invertase (TIGR01784 family)
MITNKIAQFSPEEVREYEHSVKVYRDNVNVVNTATRKAREKALAEGHEEEKVEVVINSHKAGLPIDTIATITRLTLEQVIAILKEQGLNE